MASFTLFPHLPVELQLAIWALAVPDPEPEVCIVWPLYIEDEIKEPEEPALPFIVDTAWPAVAHVCRTAREAVLASGALRLRHSQTAGFAVPYRHFIPTIDTLYWGNFQTGAMCVFLKKPENALAARALRHLAVEVTDTYYPPSELAELIRQRAAGPQPPWRSSRPRAGVKRDIMGGTLDKIQVTEVPALEAHETTPMPLQDYLDRRRAELDGHVQRFERRFAVVLGDERTAWSTKDRCFSGLEIKAQTFVEYTMTENSRAQWVQVCKDRLLRNHVEDDEAPAPEPRRIPVADRRNPEEYRVLDDDSGWHSTKEYKLVVRRAYTMKYGMNPPWPHF